LAAAHLKFGVFEPQTLGSPKVARHVQLDESKHTAEYEPATQQEQVYLEPQALIAPASLAILGSDENLYSRIQQLQDLLSQTQEQQRQQQIQHEHQRSLLECSCRELQSEASVVNSNLVASRREVELLRLRLEEVEVCSRRCGSEKLRQGLCLIAGCL
jgi:hypothetical protein